MALTLTEIAVMPGTANKRMAVWRVTGDGASYQINVVDLKMSKIEAAWTENVNNEKEINVHIAVQDYLDSVVTVLELGDGLGSELIQSTKEILLFVIGY